MVRLAGLTPRHSHHGGAAGWLLLIIALLALAWLFRSTWIAWLPADWRPALAGIVEPTPQPAAPARIYAWQDDDGRWNYTDQPPQGRPYEVRQYRDDMNVLPSQPLRSD